MWYRAGGCLRHGLSAQTLWHWTCFRLVPCLDWIKINIFCCVSRVSVGWKRPNPSRAGLWQRKNMLVPGMSGRTGNKAIGRVRGSCIVVCLQLFSLSLWIGSLGKAKIITPNTLRILPPTSFTTSHEFIDAFSGEKLNISSRGLDPLRPNTSPVFGPI